MKKKAVIYARVSSTGDRQDTARQVADLTAYAEKEGITVVRIFEEKASEAKDDREVLAECVAFLRAGNADTLLLSELSRLGRSVRKILDVTDDLTKAGIDIHILDLKIDTLLTDGHGDDGRGFAGEVSCSGEAPQEGYVGEGHSGGLRRIHFYCTKSQESNREYLTLFVGQVYNTYVRMNHKNSVKKTE